MSGAQAYRFQIETRLPRSLTFTEFRAFSRSIFANTNLATTDIACSPGVIVEIITSVEGTDAIVASNVAVAAFKSALESLGFKTDKLTILTKFLDDARGSGRKLN